MIGSCGRDCDYCEAGCRRENDILGETITQEPSFPYMEFLLPTDFDQAKRALQKILEARYPGGVFSLSSWRYIGLGGDQISQFLKFYILYSREQKDYISVSSFLSFRNGMLAKYPGTVLTDDKLNEWLNAMIEASNNGTLPDSILKPYAYVPEETPLISAIGEKIAAPVGKSLTPLFFVAGAVAVIYLLGRETIRHPKQTRELFSRSK